LAEVLITLGIIGVVAAVTLPSIITNIQNRGYVEGLKKNYSVLQQVTNKIIEEEGPPTAWSWSSSRSDADNSGNDYILNLYKKHLMVARACSNNIYSCPEIPELWSRANNRQLIRYKALNGETNPIGVFDCIFCRSFPMQLEDGTFVGITFFTTPGQILWGRPKMYFTIDVNGSKGPNKVGRDVFFLYMNHNDPSGKILPYVNGVIDGSGGGDFSQADTCDKGKSGVSCAYRVISEGKMNY